MTEILGVLIIGTLFGFCLGTLFGWGLAFRHVNQKFEQFDRAVAEQAAVEAARLHRDGE
jgi:hypothetical protein